MLIIKGFICCLFGAFLVYLGALQIAGAVLPKDYAYRVGEMHGAWIREEVLGLPPIDKKESSHD